MKKDEVKIQTITNDLKNKSYHSFCPVCRSNVLKDKYIIDNFTIVLCQSCKLVFVKEKLSQQELDYYYCKEDDCGMDADFVYLNQENIENVKYYYENLKSFILKKISSGKILDVGCNAGFFLDVMKGFECYGIDRSPNHGKIAQERYGKNIFIGTFEDYPVPDFLFDCITLQDVLDHMTDPLEVLKKCNKLLRPGGLLVIKVHDISCLYAKITGKKFYAFLPPWHLFYFSKNSLSTVLKNSSFDIDCFKYMSHLMFLSTVFYRLSRRKPIENRNGVFFKLFKLFNGTWLGRKKIRKNLHDIITVFAVKK